MYSYTKELDIATRAAHQAGKIQLDGLSRTSANVSHKEDSSPVSDIDRTCEACIRHQLGCAFPDDGILGEEYGEHKGTSTRRWILDPLDGTRPYLRGIPTYSVLIALEEEGMPVVGVMHFPAFKETYYARHRHGAYCNERAISVSSCNALHDAMGSILGLREYDHTTQGESLMTLIHALDYCYGFMDAYSYACLACGKLDVIVNMLDKPWDCAAACCIIREAGGTCTDIRGVRTHESGTVVATNTILHSATLDFFSPLS